MSGNGIVVTGYSDTAALQFKSLLRPVSIYLSSKGCRCYTPQYTRGPYTNRLTARKHQPKLRILSFGLQACQSKFIESVRTGQYLGSGWPYNFLRKPQAWNSRVYNGHSDQVPFFVSPLKGVSWYPRKREWHVQWVEDGIHRIRAFKTVWGIVKGRRRAEHFRTTLESLGRVDNRQTLRQKKESNARRSQIQRLQRKATFVRVKEDLIAEWDRYWDSVKHHWEDNHIKQQRKKFGKIVDPTYKAPDIDIERLRKMR